VLLAVAATHGYAATYSMNVRDPFDLHSSPAFNIIRGTASNITKRVREAGTQAYDTSRQAVEDMPSISIPQNVPSFTNAQREIENRAWGAPGITARSHSGSANGGVISGMQDRMGTLFEKNKELPMYKDKPYSYASSRRRQPLWRRKRIIGVAVAFFITVLYFLGIFTHDGAAKNKAGNRWTFLLGQEKGGEQVEWLGRRERVKEAFISSWDSYSRYAWGKYICPGSSELT
jgi:hypothetical protein